MAVESGHVEMRLSEGQAHEWFRLTGLDGYAELGIHLPGADSVVGVGIDARGDPKQDLLSRIPAARLRLQGQQLLLPVHHEAAHACVHGEGDVLVRFVVPVIIDPLHGKAGGHGRIDLPGGDHVQPQALLLHDPAHLPEGGGLAGVQDLGPCREAPGKGFRVQAAVVPDPVLVHEIQGRAVGFSQSQGVLVGEVQPPVPPGHVRAKGGFGKRWVG